MELFFDFQVAKRPLMERLKFKHLDGVFGMILFFGILKISGFVYVRMNFILQLQSWQSRPIHFGKLALTHYFNSASLLSYLDHMEQIPFLFMTLGNKFLYKERFTNFQNVLQRFISLLILKIGKCFQHTFQKDFSSIEIEFSIEFFKKIRRHFFTRRYDHFLVFKRLVNNNFSQFLFREII